MNRALLPTCAKQSSYPKPATSQNAFGFLVNRIRRQRRMLAINPHRFRVERTVAPGIRPSRQQRQNRIHDDLTGATRTQEPAPDSIRISQRRATVSFAQCDCRMPERTSASPPLDDKMCRRRDACRRTIGRSPSRNRPDGVISDQALNRATKTAVDLTRRPRKAALSLVRLDGKHRRFHC